MASIAPSLIHALMPFKEHYTHQNAGAVAMVCRDMITSSQLGDKVHVFGRALNHDPISRPYTALDPEMSFLFGNNLGLARAYLTHLKTLLKQPDWVEVHGRCQVAAYIAKKRSDLKVILVLHNDPREMKGAKTVEERQVLAQNLCGVFAVSSYLMSCFKDGLNKNDLKNLIMQVTPHGVDPVEDSKKVIASKKNTIVITGRMVPEKGMLEAADKLIVRTEKEGKYGRMLGWFYKDQESKYSINEVMIEQGYAWEYDGSKKEKDLQTLRDRRKAPDE